LTERSTPSTPKASSVMRGDDAPGHLMSIAERHLQRAHEPVGEVGGGRVRWCVEAGFRSNYSRSL
jgi:hypothetical protein